MQKYTTVPEMFKIGNLFSSSQVGFLNNLGRRRGKLGKLGLITS